MSSKPTLIYWDSCVYISLIQETSHRIEVLKEIYEQAKAGKIVFVASTFVIAEVCKIKGSELDLAGQAGKIRAFFENPYIKIRALDRATAEDAAEICRKFSHITPSDAVHLATALRAGCEHFHTYDGESGGPTKLLAHDGTIGSPPLSIKLPSPILFQTQQGLFDQAPPPADS
jgi:predicted nucleic acid-binding protein